MPVSAGLRENLKLAAKKRAKARRRQQRHAEKLRASRGEKSLLEMGSVTDATRQDYGNKLGGVSLSPPRRSHRGAARRGPVRVLRLPLPEQRGQQLRSKLQAALEYERPEAAREGKLRLPRFRRALKGWRKLAPAQSRLPMLEFLKSAISGLMIRGGFYEMALCNETSFSTYARPGEMLKMKPADFVLANKIYHHAVLVVAPFERGEGSKTGVYDELEGSIETCNRRMRTCGASRRRSTFRCGASAPRLWAYRTWPSARTRTVMVEHRGIIS